MAQDSKAEITGSIGSIVLGMLEVQVVSSTTAVHFHVHSEEFMAQTPTLKAPQGDQRVGLHKYECYVEVFFLWYMVLELCQEYGSLEKIRGPSIDPK